METDVGRGVPSSEKFDFSTEMLHFVIFAYFHPPYNARLYRSVNHKGT